MAKASEVPDLGPSTPFREAAARVVEARAAELFALRDNVLDTDDIERVHDMRVASRRLRAVLEVFEPSFPRKAHRAVLREVKDLADVLGERRDPDVAIEILERVQDALPIDDAAGLRGLVDELRARQQRANEQLAAALRKIEQKDLEGRIEALVGSARGAAERESVV